ncbi:MAG: dihydrolipoamide acetyltransferase family protein [Methyloceanibacter sp.]
MIRDVILPQLAMGMSVGTIVEWALREGEHVDCEQALLTLETEKVATELPAPYSGFLHIVAPTNVAVPVETVIAKIADTEAEYRQLVERATVIGEGAASGTVAAASSAPRQAAARPATERIRASGLAKRIAQQRGIDLAVITGTGPHGRIVRRDVEAAGAEVGRPVAAGMPAAAAVAASRATMRERARIPITGMRRTIAERMVKAKTTAAHTYAFFEVDVTKLVDVQKTIRAREEQLGTRVSQVAFFAKALALACVEVPICNATITGDDIVAWDNVNMGIAVALPGKGEYDSALVVPVIRDVECKGVLAIDREIKDLIARARAGSLGAADMADGTVTLSSTAGFLPGAWAVSTPLINQPQVLNFQPGSPIERPVVVDGQVVVRTMLACGLSFDHRAMDGEPVGRFVRKLADLLTNPELMVL